MIASDVQAEPRPEHDDSPFKSPGAIPTNVADYLRIMSESRPHQPAVASVTGRNTDGNPLYTTISFAELEKRTLRYARGLSSVGIAQGTRTLVMVRPGVDFIGVIFALFRLGAVPVLIDPGMGVRRLLECIHGVSPEALVGIPLAHYVRMCRPSYFASVRAAVVVGTRRIGRFPTLADLAEESEALPVETRITADDIAAILFTSGSTGPAKGVVYQHGMFNAQVEIIRKVYGIQPGEVDLPTFPLFALFGPALGMSSVVPQMDPRYPGRVNPAKIVQAIQERGVTNSFGSPALWWRVGSYCVDRGIVLSSLRRILIAGAPVAIDLVEMLRRILSPSADLHTPYGATESLPVTTISGRELLQECAVPYRNGAGICVGRSVPGVDIRLTPIRDEAMTGGSAHGSVSRGQPGEITVRGPVVTHHYHELPEAERLAKIYDGDTIWHRMGDVGVLDDTGRLWFWGRKAHRVVTEHGTLFSIPCEAIFNQHPRVSRSALVGIGPSGSQTPVMVVELKPESGVFRIAQFLQTLSAGIRPVGRDKLISELQDLGRQHDHTRTIHHFLFHTSFPVDIRHNAKINREALAQWASRRLR